MKNKNPNILHNGDNQLMYFCKGKFHPVGKQTFITTKNHRNFLIVSEFGDWSPFLTWAEVEERIARLEQDYPNKPDFFFRVVERL